MNNGPVIGYEEDVGRRTTFRLFYPESVFSDTVHYDPNTTAVLVVFKPHDLKWLWDLLSGQRLIVSQFHLSCFCYSRHLQYCTSTSWDYLGAFSEMGTDQQVI